MREGVLGRVKLIQVSFGFAPTFREDSRLFNKALGGGGILDVGCYTVSIARLVAGAAAGETFANPIEVQGLSLPCESGVDAVATANLKFPNGVLAQISCGVGLRQTNELVVFGEMGRMTVPAFWVPPGPISILDYANDSVTEVETDSFAFRYALQADAVAESLEKRQSPLMSWADSLGNMATLDTWRKSIGLTYEADEKAG